MHESDNGSSPGFWEAIRQQWRWLVLVTGVVGLMGIILIVIHYTTQIPVRMYITDAAELAYLREYAGLYNNIAILVLWTGAVVAATSGWLGTFQSQARRVFVWTVALVTGGLAIDDWFMVHEIGGYWLALATNAEDVPAQRQVLEGWVFAAMIAAGIAWFVWMRHEIQKSPWPLLLLGILGFGTSVAMDIGPQFVDVLVGRPLWFHTTWMVGEELAKYVGIGGFALYAILTAAPNLRQRGVTG